ncbi:hypothetical protein OAG53_00970 [Akkermansiaceae bacterium]|nr:hypothetical protein [Akkermansiaceae bacterium]
MKNIFYILAVLAVGAAAYTGWQVKDKTASEIDARDVLRIENGRQSKSIDQKKEEKAESITAADTARSEKDETVAKLDSAKSNFSAAERTLDEEEARLAEQNERAANVDKLIAEIKQSIGDPNIEIQDVPDIVSSLEEDKKTKDKQLEELEIVRENLEKTIASTKEDITRKETKIAERKARIAGNTFSATVSTVNNQWGFLVINAGEKSGLAGDSKLLLTRNGRLLGKVLVSSLEGNQSIGEIVPDSLAPGVRAQAGDVVILEDTAAN